MSENRNLSPEQLSILLKMASAKLGKDPVRLKSELESGSYDQVLESLGGDKEKLRAMIEDRAAMEKLLESPQIKTLLREIMGKK